MSPVGLLNVIRRKARGKIKQADREIVTDWIFLTVVKMSPVHHSKTMIFYYENILGRF